MTGKCFLVATPIGNLKDITLRALETLKEVDVIACEDTRHTLVLLNHYAIKKPLISYYQHKEREGAAQIMALLNEGKNVALVSDAGMPCISDPGSILVGTLRESGLDVTVIPGASALTAAVALSGIEGTFSFIGFLGDKNKDKLDKIKPFIDSPTALVIYCSPHDLIKNLAFLFEILGARRTHVIKEITKIYEKAVVGTLGQIEIENPRGEYVIIVEAANKPVNDVEKIDFAAELKVLIAGGMQKKDAVSLVCEKYGVSKNRVYPFSIGL
ncbi:MAG: 16S rRNA (cytidine(1402)-2'-O)-methyltransferase [Clostridia bacterium]|nr:16S rRNA (cytidine(1402)-2'-O)-methyltransferase [Clostridia bacterium]